MGLFSRDRSKPTLSRRESLEAIPVLNRGVRSEQGTDNKLLLHVEVRRGTGFLARFQPPVMEKIIELDELGSFVFHLIDGKRDVLEIVDTFEKKYRVNRREAELSATLFLRSLTQRGVISLVVK